MTRFTYICSVCARTAKIFVINVPNFVSNVTTSVLDLQSMLDRKHWLERLIDLMLSVLRLFGNISVILIEKKTQAKIYISKGVYLNYIFFPFFFYIDTYII